MSTTFLIQAGVFLNFTPAPYHVYELYQLLSFLSIPFFDFFEENLTKIGDRRRIPEGSRHTAYRGSWEDKKTAAHSFCAAAF